MEIRELILKKRDGIALTPQEIDFLVKSITDGTCTDEQLGALVQVFYLKGLDKNELRVFTERLAHSGRVIGGRKPGVVRVDKHSTGGVGDKVSLILAPMLCACGAQVPMVSARGLMHTGGTLDKLEAIPGFKVDLPLMEMERILEEVGLFIAGPTEELVPAETRIYVTRDMTAAVDSIPMITASILSKKLSEDLDALIFDVKTGQGAFMKDRADASLLAETLVTTATALGLKAMALVTTMEEPLGRTVGNALEVKEAIEMLQGEAPADLKTVTLSLGSELLTLAGLAEDLAKARRMLERVISSKRALEKFSAMVEAQKGDIRVVEDTSLLPKAPAVVVKEAEHEGYISGINAKIIGNATIELGAGRKKRNDPVDPATGIVLKKKVGEFVEKGEPLFEIHARTMTKAKEVLSLVEKAYSFSVEGVTHERWVLDKVEARG